MPLYNIHKPVITSTVSGQTLCKYEGPAKPSNIKSSRTSRAITFGRIYRTLQYAREYYIALHDGVHLPISVNVLIILYSYIHRSPL